MPSITVLFFRTWKTEKFVLFGIDIYSYNNLMKINDNYLFEGCTICDFSSIYYFDKLLNLKIPLIFKIFINNTAFLNQFEI